MYKHCPFAYYLQYILNQKSDSGKAALQGTIVHQTIDWMAKLKKRGKTNVDPMWLLDRAWDEQVQKNENISIRKVTTRIDKETGEFKEAADFKKCRLAIEEILANEHYNPYNLDIIDSEKWFRLEMPGKEWEVKNENDEPEQFAARGFIDLVHKVDKDTIEIIDWKTGVRKSFYTQKEIDEEVLSREIQPRIYHLASYLLYPQYKNVILTFYYTGDGGPVTIALSHDDVLNTIEYLHRFLMTVKGDTLLRRNRSWKCKMCRFNKEDKCSKIWGDLHTMGGAYVSEKYKGDGKDLMEQSIDE